MFNPTELQTLRRRAQDCAYGFTDVYMTRALERLADAAGHVEGILGAYERLGMKP